MNKNLIAIIFFAVSSVSFAGESTFIDRLTQLTGKTYSDFGLHLCGVHLETDIQSENSAVVLLTFVENPLLPKKKCDALGSSSLFSCNLKEKACSSMSLHTGPSTWSTGTNLIVFPDGNFALDFIGQDGNSAWTTKYFFVPAL